MMQCPGCGVDVAAESVFCHKCGTRLDGGPREDAAGSAYDGASPDGLAPPSNAGPTRRFRNGAEPNPAAGTEKKLWEGRYSAKAMTGAWVASLLATAVLLTLAIWSWNSPAIWWMVLGAIVLLWLYQIVIFARRRLGIHYRLTSVRFFHESGILIHTTDLIEVIDMDDITYRQTLIDRLLGVGTIQIVSSDRSHPNLSIAGIENVKEVAAMMQEARHAERVRRGLHIEQI